MRAILLLGLFLALAPKVHAASELPDPMTDPSGSFGWLEGCWITRSGATREVWAQAGEAHLFGFNTVLKDGRVSFFEQLRIEKTGTAWSFFAYPRGKGPTVFPASAMGANTVTFRNDKHDFPQVIRYRRNGAGLTVEISHASGTDTRRWDFVPCKAD